MLQPTNSPRTRRVSGTNPARSHANRRLLHECRWGTEQSKQLARRWGTKRTRALQRRDATPSPILPHLPGDPHNIGYVNSNRTLAGNRKFHVPFARSSAKQIGGVRQPPSAPPILSSTGASLPPGVVRIGGARQPPVLPALTGQRKRIDGALRLRWRPDGCDLPRFDAAQFLEAATR